MLLLSGQLVLWVQSPLFASVPYTWYYVQGGYWVLFSLRILCLPRPSLPPYIFLH